MKSLTLCAYMSIACLFAFKPPIGWSFGKMPNSYAANHKVRLIAVYIELTFGS